MDLPILLIPEYRCANPRLCSTLTFPKGYLSKEWLTFVILHYHCTITHSCHNRVSRLFGAWFPKGQIARQPDREGRHTQSIHESCRSGDRFSWKSLLRCISQGRIAVLPTSPIKPTKRLIIMPSRNLQSAKNNMCKK